MVLEFVLEVDVSIPTAGGIAEGPALLMGILKEKIPPTASCCCCWGSKGGPPLDGRGIGEGERLSPR